MPSQVNSIFTPAMGPRGPGYTVGRGPTLNGVPSDSDNPPFDPVQSHPMGSYLSGLAVPSWAGYAVIAGLLGLAALKKIKWPLALMGAGAAWWFLLPASAATLVSGTGILTTGATLPLNQAALSTASDGSQYITQGGVTYPVLSIQPNPAGGQTYFLDNPTATTMGSYDPVTGQYKTYKQDNDRFFRAV